MDWKKTFNHGQWAIHSIFLVSIVSGIGATLFAFRLNNLQKTEEEQVLKVNQYIRDLKKDQSFEKIGKFLTWAESDHAHEKLRDLNRRIAETEELLEIKVSPELGKSLRTFNQLISNNSGMSSPADALKILSQKVHSLHDVASSKKYRTVESIAEKMKNRLEGLNPKNVGGSIQISYLKTDLNSLDRLIQNSTLDEGEKATFKNRFESMNDEMELLGSLNSHSRNLKTHINQASLNLAQWLIDVDKKALNLQDLRTQKQNRLIIFLCGIVAFLVVSWMGLAYLFRWQRSKISLQIEQEVKSVIENGILGDQRFLVDQYSDSTREEIVRLMDQLKVKLNLGTLLHEGLPFAGCMIDLNFKLSWFNHLFLDQLYLSEEEVRSDAFNWDYVRDYLNLDEDPIYQAMVNKIAGIYPVKVKQDELAPAQPYEMYVTPITANREERVMVFFYPLVSVNESIHEQINLSKSTMTRFIQLWNESKLDEDELKILERDFFHHDLRELYHELAQLHDRTLNEKNESLYLINNLEKEVLELKETIHYHQDLDEEKRQTAREEVKAANELKISVVSSLEKTESLMHINKSILQQNDDFKNEALRLHHLTLESMKKGKESMEILGQLDSSKSEYKKIKFELMEIKARLISLNNSLLSQLPPLDENQQKLAIRYKDELARLDLGVSNLDKKLSQVDVLLAKLTMINEKNPLEQTSFQFQTTQKDHELREALIDIQKHLNVEEGKILENFKHLHGLLKKDLRPVVQREESTSLDHFLS